MIWQQQRDFSLVFKQIGLSKQPKPRLKPVQWDLGLYYCIFWSQTTFLKFWMIIRNSIISVKILQGQDNYWKIYFRHTKHQTSRPACRLVQCKCFFPNHYLSSVQCLKFCRGPIVLNIGYFPFVNVVRTVRISVFVSLMTCLLFFPVNAHKWQNLTALLMLYYSFLLKPVILFWFTWWPKTYLDSIINTFVS